MKPKVTKAQKVAKKIADELFEHYFGTRVIRLGQITADDTVLARNLSGWSHKAVMVVVLRNLKRPARRLTGKGKP